jgi:predicted alpha/beta superfamily hydrolase
MTFASRIHLLVICILFSLAVSACAQQTPTPEAAISTYPKVTLPDTELRTIRSSATGQSYDIYVLLPTEYSSSKAYPVLYVLDGQWDFKLLDSVYGGLLYDGFVPEMIIVGVTYSGESPNYNALRAMDYTPSLDWSISGSGGAPKFLSFLKTELIPFIEANYQADPAHRVLMGSSFGGLFTLYAMFADTSLFEGYVSASPAVTYGDQIIFKQEAQYASEHQDLPVRLFLSVGEIEDLSRPVKEFMQTLKEHNYTDLEMETRIIEGERHSGNKPEAFNRGLRFVFQDK